MRNMSLRARLLILIGAPLLLLLLIETVISYLVGMHTANQVFDSWLLDSAHSIALEVRTDGEALHFIAAEDAIAMFEWDELDDTYFHISDTHGTKIAGDLPQPASFDLAALREGPVYRDAPINGREGRMVTVLSDAGKAGEFVVQVAETLNKRHDMTAQILTLITLKKTALLLGAMVAIGIAIRRGLAPLADLAAQLAARSPRDLQPFAAGTAPPEVKSLIENTNALLKRIEHMLGAHEQFIGNIAHQVRTPLAGIKLQTQLALREDITPGIHRALEQIAQATDHMSHVNLQLLKLARAEIAFDRGPCASPINLVTIVHACGEDSRERAREHDVTVQVDTIDDHAEVEGDPALLREMLNNLVENAIIYGRPHGHVWIGLRQDAEKVHLVVEDDGPGIPPAYRTQLFERFYRPPNSPGDGSGLGLPIVREIVRAHGGDVRLEDGASGSGTRFVVELPRRKRGMDKPTRHAA